MEALYDRPSVSIKQFHTVPIVSNLLHFLSQNLKTDTKLPCTQFANADCFETSCINPPRMQALANLPSSKQIGLLQLPTSLIFPHAQTVSDQKYVYQT